MSEVPSPVEREDGGSRCRYVIRRPEGEAELIRAKVLVLTGAVDPVVPPEAVDAVEDELRGAPGVDWQVVTYAGAMHAFAVPGTDSPEYGAQYDETADRRSWAALMAFFDEVFVMADDPALRTAAKALGVPVPADSLTLEVPGDGSVHSLRTLLSTLDAAGAELGVSGILLSE